MKESVWNRKAPIHRHDLQKRMYILPLLYCHQQIIIIFTFIKYICVIKVKIHYPDLRVILPQLIPQKIHMMAPVTPDKHQVFSVKILYAKLILLGKVMVYRNSTAYRLPRYFQSGTPAKSKHRFIENPRHHINILPQVCKYFPCIFRRVVVWNQLKFNIRTLILDLRS